MTNAVIIGTGNIAYHFFPDLDKIQELNITCIYSRSEEIANAIVRDSSIKIIYRFSEIPRNTEVVFLMVNDDSINLISKELKEHISSSTLLIHFSGSLKLSAIDNYFSNKGIIWPIQSISRTDKNLNLKETPISISYSDEETKEVLVRWVSHLSNHVVFLSPEEKKAVHLSAVFANNFTNHLYSLAEDILKNENLDFGLIKPLILKTAQKALENHPAYNQTGPARRNDQQIMAAQIDMISDPETKEIYKLISKSILKKEMK